jgi:TonB family protein
VLQGSGDKVHVAGRVTRYREDGSVIGSYDSVWILTRRGDRWGLQAWSSFAPKVEAGAVARDRPPETDVSAGATETDTVPEGPCGWFEWRTLMEGLPPTPEGAEVTKARRKRGSIKRPLSKVTHRIRGSWIVEAVVDEKGKVRDARIQARPEIEPPWPAYEEAIVRSIRRWSFEPERVDGVPRPACTTVTVVDE